MTHTINRRHQEGIINVVQLCTGLTRCIGVTRDELILDVAAPGALLHPAGLQVLERAVLGAPSAGIPRTRVLRVRASELKRREQEGVSQRVSVSLMSQHTHTVTHTKHVACMHVHGLRDKCVMTIAYLVHEIRNDTMEMEAIVEARLDKIDEIGGRNRDAI